MIENTKKPPTDQSERLHWVANVNFENCPCIRADYKFAPHNLEK